MNPLITKLKLEISSIKSRTQGHICPICGNTMHYDNNADDKWMDTAGFDGIPNETCFDYFNSIYEVCLDCGFATRNLDSDTLDNIYKYKINSVKRQIEHSFYLAQNEIELKLMLGVIRYFDNARAWHRLFTYYVKIQRKDLLSYLQPAYCYIHENAIYKDFTYRIKTHQLKPYELIDAIVYVGNLCTFGDMAAVEDLYYHIETMANSIRNHPDVPDITIGLELVKDWMHKSNNELMLSSSQYMAWHSDLLEIGAHFADKQYDEVASIIAGIHIIGDTEQANTILYNAKTRWHISHLESNIPCIALEDVERLITNNVCDQSTYIPILCVAGDIVQTPIDAAINSCCIIKSRRGKRICPLCGRTLKSKNNADFHWVFDIDIAGEPVPTKDPYLSTLYEYCPKCGFVTRNVDLWTDDERKEYDSPQVKKFIADVKKIAKNDIELALMMGTLRGTNLLGFDHLARYLSNHKCLYKISHLMSLYLSMGQELNESIMLDRLSPADYWTAIRYVRMLCLMDLWQQAELLIPHIKQRLIERPLTIPMMQDNLSEMLQSIEHGIQFTLNAELTADSE